MTDLVLTGGTVVTMDAQRRMFAPGYVSIRNGIIEGTGPAGAAPAAAARTLDAAGKVVLPGFINTHTHLFQTLLKGPGDDRKLEEWFRNVVGPASSELTEEDCYH